MITSSIHINKTPEETFESLLCFIDSRMQLKKRQGFPLNIAISGGETPKKFFEYIKDNYSDMLQWRFIRIFWVDERCVPPTAPESNFGVAYEYLLRYVPLLDGNVFRVLGENDPEKEVIHYADTLAKMLPSENDIPKFDLVLLGLGTDGHTASIFPDQKELLYSNSTVAVAIQPETQQKRITLTGKTICQAADVCFLITGKAKASILKQILQKEKGYEKYPAAHVHSALGNVDFFLDKEAAGLLSTTL